jgi:hypothetical protein
MVLPGGRTRIFPALVALVVCVAAATLAGCGAQSAGAPAPRGNATTCGVPYIFTVDGHQVPSGSCAGQMPGRPPRVAVHPGERFTLLITGNRNGAHVTRAFPVPKPTGSAVVITEVHGETVHYQARTAGRTRLQVRSQFCPSNPKVSTCSVLVVSAPGPAAAKSRCLPSPLHVKPTHMNAGGTVILSSTPFTCARTYPRGKTYTVTLRQVGRAAPLNLGAVRVKRDGVFAATVRIPARASPGESYIAAAGSPFDQCRDTASCAGYDVRLTVLPRR